MRMKPAFWCIVVWDDNQGLNIGPNQLYCMWEQECDFGRFFPTVTTAHTPYAWLSSSQDALERYRHGAPSHFLEKTDRHENTLHALNSSICSITLTTWWVFPCRNKRFNSCYEWFCRQFYVTSDVDIFDGSYSKYHILYNMKCHSILSWSQFIQC